MYTDARRHTDRRAYTQTRRDRQRQTETEAETDRGRGRQRQRQRQTEAETARRAVYQSVAVSSVPLHPKRQMAADDTMDPHLMAHKQ